MADGTMVTAKLPLQIPSEEEAVTLEKAGESAEDTSMSVMGGNFLVNLLLVASLNHLWSMINGLQLSTHMSVFNLKFPANAQFFVRFLVDVSTWDIIPVEAIWYFFELPDRGSYRLSFQSSGYEFMHAMENLTTNFTLIQVYII